MLSPNEDCFANISQDFLVCTTIHKARQLGVFQGETFVRVTLDKMTRQTKVFANSENPYFNEYFVFEIKCTLGELLRLTILYEVKRRTTCKRNPTLGELLIDMQSVWYQRNRCYFKKWGRLEATIEQQTLGEDVNDSRGYLQIDLAIVSQATNTQTLLSPYRGEAEEKDDSKSMTNVWQINHDYDDIEKNLLENINSDIRCNIRYTLVFYRGVMAKKSDYLIQFRFHPFRGKTLVAKNTQHPVWNQEIQFAWIYPSLAQTCLIQLLSHEHFQWKCVAEHEVHFEEIAFNDKPSLGPTFIHLYDNLNPTKYVGRVLLEILSDCLETLPKRQLYVKAITALDETRYWQEETFVVEFLSLQGDFIHGNISNLKIQIKFAEHISNNLECLLKTYPTQKHDTIAKSLKYFRQEAPYKAIALRVSLPDHSHKYEIERFLGEIGEFIKQQLANFQQFRLLLKGGHVQVQQKVFRDIISGIMNEVKNALTTHRLEYRGPKEPTQWDIKRLLHMQDNLVKFWDELNDLRSCLKSANVRTIDDVLQDLIRMVHKLQALGTRNRVQDEWADLILVVSAGNKDIGYCRLNAKSFQYLGTGSEECPTDQCGRIRNFIFKDTQCQHTCPNCGCIVAIVLGSLSIVIEREYTDFLNKMKSQWLNPEPFYWRPITKATNTAFKCRIFIHQAKVRPGADRSGLCDPYVRVMIASHSAETPVLYATLSPIWNSVISMDCVTLPGSIQWYDAYNAPLVAIELYDTDRRTADDYLGCGTLAIAVISLEAQSLYEDNAPTAEKGIDAQNAWETFKALPNLSPPPLKWVPIALNGVTKAEVLMSAEMVELVLDDNKMVKVMTEPQVSEGIPAAIKPVMKNYVVEVIFAGFRNYTKSSVFSGRHRVKLMLADLLLTSGLSATRLKDSINFLIPYASGVVSLPDQLDYWPAIIATDVVITSSKDQEVTLGAVLIANSKKYLQQHKELKCIALGSSEESDGEINTALNINPEEDSESEPLLKNTENIPSFWSRLTKNVIAKPPVNNDPYGLSDVLDEKAFTWWTKFYNSGLIASGHPLSRFKHKLCIYHHELEKQAEFSHLNDWAEPLHMVHGVRSKRNSPPKEEIYAILKMKIKITACQWDHSANVDGSLLRPMATALNPLYQAELKCLGEMTKLVVRVYVVQGLQLRPSQKHAQADSYVRVQLGQQQVMNRAEYVANESNPVFGKCFELEGVLPREHILEISLFNRHSLRDEAIGSTYIDLEDRWRSQHRATVGIAQEFSSCGYNKWRDSRKPKEILEEICHRKGVKMPRFEDDVIEIDGMAIEDETEIATEEDLHQRLSLTALKRLQDLPSFGYKLVPEHVETRSLYRTECPGIEQSTFPPLFLSSSLHEKSNQNSQKGKIQLWLELYEGNNINLPPVIDITPQPPELYELRLVIFGVSDVLLDERNIFGTAMSDIYVKGWCSNPDAAQTTDIHYRSLDGEGKFNWRMVFPFKYSSIEDMMVVKRRAGLMDEYQSKQPPILFLQIWDDDIISQDDFLGSLEINLSNFPQPFETAKKCQLTPHENLMSSLLAHGPQMSRRPANVSNNNNNYSPVKLMNIFRQKKVRGWFPVRGHIPEMGNKIGLAGKIELELEVVTEKEASLYPVGLGRNPPNALPEPSRPTSSFNPFTSPWKGFKQIVAPSLWKYLLIIGLLVLLGFAIFLFKKMKTSKNLCIPIRLINLKVKL
uniref:C2 domain-containing protein n=1 Tax=Stomoxys calcitrans TaxID=35570 RepID=A0A1I8QEL5_STOCA